MPKDGMVCEGAERLGEVLLTRWVDWDHKWRAIASESHQDMSQAGRTDSSFPKKSRVGKAVCRKNPILIFFLSFVTSLSFSGNVMR